MSSDDIYVDPERTRGLITSINASADALTTVHPDDQVLTIAGAAPGTGIEAACVSGAQSATTAIGTTTEKVRVIAVSTDVGLTEIETQDRTSAVKITQAGPR
ncbi:hypothetical protein OHB26_03225 [Nocardia sp. NBC_01503]|uniref:hypothetical protein n=1 Tax=Nocardia sp. NBC_01503 TaxID=2975997 RepID=UPI002E7C1BAF|nr:hypothetical protein [Nocardia sp. NBC_01503]WTL33276.1 hypothetical protein OHB26_03225 [Nocardia sp. NBC_01503]